MDNDCGESIIDNKILTSLSSLDKQIIYNMEWDVGCHTKFSGTILDVLKTTVKYGGYTTQFFMGSPYTHNRTKISLQDIDLSKNLLNRFPINLFTHYPLNTNLVGSISSLAWTGDEKQDIATKNVISGINYELDILSNFNGGVVVHPGSYKDRKLGLKTISKTINRIENLNGSNSRLILENCAGEGNKLASTLDEIRLIIDEVEPKKRNNIGVCIDTCHIFAHGKYDFSLIEDIDNFFSDSQTIFGLEKIKLFHLNDSMCKKGSRKDRHACLGTGCIWNESFDSLVYFLNKCKNLEIPCVLETHGTDMLVLSSLYKVYNEKDML